jgi:hypothetical protein
MQKCADGTVDFGQAGRAGEGQLSGPLLQPGNYHCGSKVPGRFEPIRSFAASPSSMMARYPLLSVKRSYVRPTVE